MITRKLTRSTLAPAFIAAAFIGLASVASAQTETGDAAAKQKEALEWLDAFASRQVLFHADDLKKARARVAAMTPEEAAKWWEEKAPQREALSSPEWLETESWLRKFLDVQAIYDDEEIRSFQGEAAADAKVSGESLQEILDRVTQTRRRLAAGSQGAAEVRKMQVAANEAFKQDQVRQREAARRQARSTASAPSATPSTASAAARNRNRPARFNAPLVDSMDAARWAVVSDVFPRW